MIRTAILFAAMAPALAHAGLLDPSVWDVNPMTPHHSEGAFVVQCRDLVTGDRYTWTSKTVRRIYNPPRILGNAYLVVMDTKGLLHKLDNGTKDVDCVKTRGGLP